MLVGKSGTGKSNFVESVRVLRDFLLSPRSVQVIQAEWPRICPAIKSESAPWFEVEFSISGIAERFTYHLEFEKRGPQHPPTEEFLRLGDKILFHQVNSGWVTEPELLQIPPSGPVALGRIPRKPTQCEGLAKQGN